MAFSPSPGRAQVCTILTTETESIVASTSVRLKRTKSQMLSILIEEALSARGLM